MTAKQRTWCREQAVWFGEGAWRLDGCVAPSDQDLAGPVLRAWSDYVATHSLLARSDVTATTTSGLTAPLRAALEAIAAGGGEATRSAAASGEPVPLRKENACVASSPVRRRWTSATR